MSNIKVHSCVLSERCRCGQKSSPAFARIELSSGLSLTVEINRGGLSWPSDLQPSSQLNDEAVEKVRAALVALLLESWPAPRGTGGF